MNVRFYLRSQDVAHADSTVGFPVVDDAFPVAGHKKVRPQVRRLELIFLCQLDEGTSIITNYG